ncbi:MAG TPA: Gfo/Idh/MocA family oxidoreductase [Abditibacteriaceae bacterium]|nr:Gfo/Idh/MocA family oxidoreductase [Abditibacteriaceae bacterium]
MQKSDIIHIGVAGLGPRSRSWLYLLESFPQCRVVALCDRREPALQEALVPRAANGVKGYQEYTQLLDHPGLDALVILSDPTTQTALAVQAMQAGKHVTTEVPACYTLEDCWKLVLAVERSGCIYQLAEQVRYWGFIQAWKKVVASGELGKPLYAEGEYLHGLLHTTHPYFQDPETGQGFTPEQSLNNPRAAKTWRHTAHPIGYLPHTLSPLLYVLDDRVIEVTAMATQPRSYYEENIEQSDVEVALMKTANDVVLRVMVSFVPPSAPRGETQCHWYQVRGTRGALESKRSGWDKHKMWLADHQMADWSAMGWSTDVVEAPPEARLSGHGGIDYYAVATWLDAIRRNVMPPLDVYKSIETAAPSAAAIASLECGSQLTKVPNFRPGPHRSIGQEPATRDFTV